MINRYLPLFSLLLMGSIVNAQSNYSDYAAQTSRINALAKNYPSLVSVKSLTKTSGNKDVWLITLGTGNRETKPAIAVIGGTEGNHLLGTELAIGFAEDLLMGSGSDSIKSLLEKTSFYIVPNMSPDAMEQYFGKLQYERQGNASPTDDDRDGKTDEDGYDDLDGNGVITWMRIESPVGEYKTHPADARVLVKADINKGEKGIYNIFPEGIDNDKDDEYNEDGPGGVWFNRNLSYKHPSFSPGSGEFAVSEKETRALLDFLFERYNVYAVLSFGSNNNLSTPYTYNATAATQNIVAGWLQPDVKIDSLVSDLYNKTVGLKDAPKTHTGGGDILSWAYYHYGRYSFGTPGWWVPKTKPDTTKGEKALSPDEPIANYLRWASQQGIKGNFTEWKLINHPDFPGQKVEVGGLHPFMLTNPPYTMVPDLVKKHTRFLVSLAGHQPEIDIINLKTEKLGNDITRVTVEIINKGALSSHSKLGERSYWVKRINVKLNTSGTQSIVSGKKIQLLGALEGYSTQKLTWLVRGKGKFEIEAGSPTTGFRKIEINL